jgi:UDP-N-acetylglucosamine 2-epimerase (non-hydrolysing)
MMGRMIRPVVHVTGARPNFPKAAPVLRALAGFGIRQLLVHTGQHYDKNMSEIFFDQLGLPLPDVNLGVGSGSHAAQTAAIMIELETLFLREPPRLVIVYGDVNSTVAAALVAAKLGIELAHVEAGLRSFDLSMPEEINRIVTDRLCTLLFVTSPEAIGNLGNEGADPRTIHFVGNPMIDTLLANLSSLDASAVRSALGLTGPYVVATLHRPSNVDDPAIIHSLVRELHQVCDRVPVVLPLHPRGRQRLTSAGLLKHSGMHVVDPMGYLQFISLISEAAAVITDSGGVQEETTMLGVPCLTLRPNTERPVTITDGTNELVRLADLARRVKAIIGAERPATWPTPPLWDGRSGARIARIVARHLGEAALKLD